MNRILPAINITSDESRIGPDALTSLMASSEVPLELEQALRGPQSSEVLKVAASARHELLGIAGLALQNGTLLGPFVHARSRGNGLGRKLLVATEQFAARYQLFELMVKVPEHARGFFEACGYGAVGESGTGPAASGTHQYMRRFPRRQTNYGRRIAQIGASLGVPENYARTHRLPLQVEATSLSSPIPDVYQRPQRMTPSTRRAWIAMAQAADQDGVKLQLVSAFRSVGYQTELLRRKLNKGQTLEQILAVSAVPGFSEHHSGRALDLTAPDSPVLEEAFENTSAFSWLTRRAGAFGFRLSYPRNNPHGIAYEPWHWYWTGNRI